MSAQIQNHESMTLHRATIEALPPETIAQLKDGFLAAHPELAGKYARWLTHPRLPTAFIIWAFDERSRRQS